MRLRTGLILYICLIFLGCNSKDSLPQVSPPTNLSVNASISNDGSGLVTVTATASDCNYYEFEFGENQNDPAVTDEDGIVQYSYAKSGNYFITVRAYANTEVFTQKSISVNVGVHVNDEDLIPKQGYSTPTTYEGYNLIWADEFEGLELNTDIWKHELGTGSNGWGNNELEYYRKENTRVNNGCLFIEAKKENFGGRNYTSSRIITKGNKAFKFGRIDIRAALPKGQGIWPALWMLGSNIDALGWPGCGEIDIMEMVGGTGKDNTVHGTAHWDNAGSYASYGKGYTLPSGIFADEFHVFSIVWDATSIKWYMDDIMYNVIDITPQGLSEFQNDFFLIFNVAVGGNWPGSPDATTFFPQHMIVDYVRVFQSQ